MHRGRIVAATLVTRHNSRVLKRYRTSGTGDVALVTGTLAAPIVLGAGLMLVLTLADPLLGLAFPARPWLLALTVVAGLGLAVTGGAATTLVTRNAEQAAFTTMPGVALLLVALMGAPAVPADGWWPLLMLPGVGVGHLAELAATGAAATTCTLLAPAGCVLWPVVLGEPAPPPLQLGAPLHDVNPFAGPAAARGLIRTT